MEPDAKQSSAIHRGRKSGAEETKHIREIVKIKVPVFRMIVFNRSKSLVRFISQSFQSRAKKDSSSKYELHGRCRM